MFKLQTFLVRMTFRRRFLEVGIRINSFLLVYNFESFIYTNCIDRLIAIYVYSLRDYNFNVAVYLHPTLYPLNHVCHVLSYSILVWSLEATWRRNTERSKVYSIFVDF